MYSVEIEFPERFDAGRVYKVGDAYPRKGFAPPKGRAEALASGEQCDMNRTGKVYIKSISEPIADIPEMDEPKPEKKSKKKE